MKYLFLLLIILLLEIFPAQAQIPPSLKRQPVITSSSEDTRGMISMASHHSVNDTAHRLEQLIREKGLSLFGKIDHRSYAERSHLSLRPTVLVLFGDALSNTQLLHQEQMLGLDLPFKFLIWQAPDNKVYVTWNNPYFLARRHGLPQELELLARISQLQSNLAQQACSP